MQASLLEPGDRLLSHDLQWIAVEDLLDTGETEAVYNLRIADYHTYFVCDWDWSFSVWSHNAYAVINASVGTRQFRFEQDCQNNTVLARGEIEREGAESNTRDGTAQAAYRRLHINEHPLRNQLEAGHIIGTGMGGPDIVANITSMSRAFNRGSGSQWRALEQQIQDHLETHTNQRFFMTATLDYRVPEGHIPYSIDVKVRRGSQQGPIVIQQFFTHVGA